jgi:hypothetical protein
MPAARATVSVFPQPAAATMNARRARASSSAGSGVIDPVGESLKFLREIRSLYRGKRSHDQLAQSFARVRALEPPGLLGGQPCSSTNLILRLSVRKPIIYVRPRGLIQSTGD